MKMKTYLAIAVLGACLAASLMWLGSDRGTLMPRSFSHGEYATATSPIMPVRGVDSGASSESANASPPDVNANGVTSPSIPHPSDGWRLLRNDEYHFEVDYPPDWILARNITDVARNKKPVRWSTNLISSRPAPDGSQITVPFVIAVYDLPSVPVRQWLNDAYSLGAYALQSGDTETALAAAYSSTPAIFYSQGQIGQMSFFQLNSSGPVLVASTYLYSGSTNFVYLLEMHLPLSANTSTPDEYDRLFVRAYDRILSSFKID